MRTETKTVYITDDGLEFTSKDGTLRHEAELALAKFCEDKFYSSSNDRDEIITTLVQYARDLAPLLNALVKS